jgi:hypothetical protein
MKASIIFVSTLIAPFVAGCVTAHIRVDSCVSTGGPGREFGGTVWDSGTQVCQGQGIARNPGEKPCLKCRDGTSFCLSTDGKEANYKNGGYTATLKSNSLAKLQRPCGGVAEKWSYADSVMSCLTDGHPSCKGDGGKPGCPTSQKLGEKGWNSW